MRLGNVMTSAEHPLIRTLDGSSLSVTSPTAGSVLNSYSLVPGFPMLMGKFGERVRQNATFHRLPKQLNSCFTALNYLHTGYHELVQSVAAHLDERELRTLDPIQRGRLTIPVEAFLLHAAQVQDCWNSLLALTLPQGANSMPSSFSDTIKALESAKKSPGQLPEDIKASVRSYWDSHGQKLRDYRNYTVHFGEPCSDLMAFKTDADEVALVFRLLGNPEEKSTRKATWGEPEVHALVYVLAELEALISFTGWLVTKLLGDVEGKITLSIPLITPTDPAVIGTNVKHRGVTPANPKWIMEVVEKAATQHNVRGRGSGAKAT